MTHVTCRLTPRTGISSGTLRSVIEYWLPFYPASAAMTRRFLARNGPVYCLIFSGCSCISLQEKCYTSLSSNAGKRSFYRATICSSKCGQCHVVSVRRKMNTNSLTRVSYTACLLFFPHNISANQIMQFRSANYIM